MLAVFLSWLAPLGKQTAKHQGIMFCGNFTLQRVVLRLLCSVVVLSCVLAVEPVRAQSVGIGTTTPHATARLDIWDTIRGLLIPRLTTQQRDAIQNPAHTLMIFNIDSFCLEVYDTVTHRWYTIACPRWCFPPDCQPILLGPATVCTGDTITYTATGCPGNITYQWTVSPGWTVLSGLGSPVLTVIPDTTDGTLTVSICNQCGCAGSVSVSVVADSCAGFCQVLGSSYVERVHALIRTQDGGYALAGSIRMGNTTGKYEFHVIKLDAAGAIQWTRTIGVSTTEEQAYGVAQTTDGGFVIAGYTYHNANHYDGYIVKLNSLGAFQWGTAWGGSSHDSLFGITATSDGGFALTGITTSYGANGGDIWMMKFNSTGTFQWGRIIALDNYREAGNAIIQTYDGGYAIAGWVQRGTHTDIGVVKLDASGNLQWTQRIGGAGMENAYAIIQTQDSGFAVVGYTTSFGQGGRDVYLVKLDNAGNIQWTRTIGGSADDEGHALIQTSDGGLAIAGWTRSVGGAGAGQRAYVVKLDANGDLQWTQAIQVGALASAEGIVQNSDGTYVIAGYTSSSGNPNSDMDLFLVKLSAHGALMNCPGLCESSSGGAIGSGVSNTSGGNLSGLVPASASWGGSTGSAGSVLQVCP